MTYTKKYRRSGWFLEPIRHSLSAKGISTGRKSYAKDISLSDIKKYYSDLGYADVFGEKTYLIDKKHFKNMKIVDDKARTNKKSHIFFRVISNGKLLSGQGDYTTHGWIVDNKIYQWG